MDPPIFQQMFMVGAHANFSFQMQFRLRVSKKIPKSDGIALV